MQWLCHIKNKTQNKKRHLVIGPKLRYYNYLLIGVYDYLAMAGYNIWEANRKVTQHFNYSVLTVHGVCIHGSPSICIGRDLLVLEKKKKKNKKTIQVQHRNTLYSRLYVPYKMVRPGNANMVKAGLCSQVIFYKRNFSS